MLAGAEAENHDTEACISDINEELPNNGELPCSRPLSHKEKESLESSILLMPLFWGSSLSCLVVANLNYITYVTTNVFKLNSKSHECIDW